MDCCLCIDLFYQWELRNVLILVNWVSLIIIFRFTGYHTHNSPKAYKRISKKANNTGVDTQVVVHLNLL